MAFLARGYTPGLAPYGDVMNRAIDHVLSVQAINGSLMGGGGQMYSHNIATLMLSEVSGMADPERQACIEAALQKAIRLILAVTPIMKPILKNTKAGSKCCKKRGRISWI